jgi:hypothetical protein
MMGYSDLSLIDQEIQKNINYSNLDKIEAHLKEEM